MDYDTARHLLGEKIRLIRQERQIKQEKLAELINKSTEMVSFLERGERLPSFETLIDLSNALNISLSDLLNFEEEYNRDVDAIPAPIPSSSIPDPIEDPIKSKPQRETDLERMEEGFNNLKGLEQLANEYGIFDILQDNGAKVLQVLILLGLKVVDGREGNDAKDDEGNEYELKTINIAPRKNEPKKRNTGVTTHHHMNKDILDKYRNVKAWYIGVYNDIELAEIWEVHPSILENLFSDWEKRVVEKGVQLNNPKFPLKLVRTGKLVYPDAPVLDEFSEQNQNQKLDQS